MALLDETNCSFCLFPGGLLRALKMSVCTENLELRLKEYCASILFSSDVCLSHFKI